jgi:hypothetical protein
MAEIQSSSTCFSSLFFVATESLRRGFTTSIIKSNTKTIN